MATAEQIQQVIADYHTSYAPVVTQPANPPRVQRLLDLAARNGLAVEETAIDASERKMVKNLAIRSWTIKLPTDHPNASWDFSQLWINWSKWDDDRSPGRVRVTHYGLTRKTRKIKLCDVVFWMQTMARV